MQKLKIYNTLSGSKEIFVPLNDDIVTMYVCGPTVYGEPHLGHARPAITFDILFRYLSFLGYKVRYVRNITDVGHLLNDSDDTVVFYIRMIVDNEERIWTIETNNFREESRGSHKPTTAL